MLSYCQENSCFTFLILFQDNENMENDIPCFLLDVTSLYSLKRGSVTGILTFFGQNGETVPSLSYKIILEQEKETTHHLFALDKNAGTWKTSA